MSQLFPDVLPVVPTHAVGRHRGRKVPEAVPAREVLVGQDLGDHRALAAGRALQAGRHAAPCGLFGRAPRSEPLAGQKLVGNLVARWAAVAAPAFLLPPVSALLDQAIVAQEWNCCGLWPDEAVAFGDVGDDVALGALQPRPHQLLGKDGIGGWIGIPFSR